MTYEELLMESEKENLIIREKNLPGYKGRIYKNRIAIRQNLTTTEKACILAEELGHHHTTVGNILDQSDPGNRKQELRARLMAYDKMIGLIGIVRAYQHRCQNLTDMAEYLEVTEEFLKEALEQYRRKYGQKAEVDNYIIIFEPYLAVMERYE